MKDSIILENESIFAEISRNSGAILAFESKKTGWKIHNRAELSRSFRFLVPAQERRNNIVEGMSHSPTEVNISEDKTRVTLHWDNPLSSPAGTLDLSFTAKIYLNDEGLCFEAKLSNNSNQVVECVSWPWLGDIRPQNPENSLERINIAYAAMAKQSLFPVFQSEVGYYGTDYPIQNVRTPDSPFVMVQSEDQGFYAGYHDATSKNMLQFTFELKPGFEQAESPDRGSVCREKELAGQPAHTEFYCTHFVFANPGETVSLRKVVLKPYVGSWHSGADCYKDWSSKNLSYARPPSWAEKVHAWQQIHINSPEDELRCKYKDLVKYGEDCAKHGVKAIQLTGWTIGGQDRGNPSHDIDPRLGTKKDLRDAITKIQDMGVNVILFNKYTWADRAEEWFREELVKYAVKDPYGDYYMHPGYQYQTPIQYADINTRRLIPMCMNSEKWREISFNEFSKNFELGAMGILYDECQHHGNARYCFDTEHGHHVPAYVYAGDFPLAEGLRKIANEHNPDFLMAGEACYDLELQHYSISYFRIPINHVPLHRYINPDAEMMIAITGFNDRNMLNQAMMFRYIISYEPRNFKGRLDEFPATLEYGKLIDSLKKRYSGYLWDAEFRHTVGAKCFVNDKPLETYSVFVNKRTGERAVVVANFTNDKIENVRVKLDESVGKLQIVSPEKPEPENVDGGVTVLPQSVVVFLELK